MFFNHTFNSWKPGQDRSKQQKGSFGWKRRSSHHQLILGLALESIRQTQPKLLQILGEQCCPGLGLSVTTFWTIIAHQGDIIQKMKEMKSATNYCTAIAYFDWFFLQFLHRHLWIFESQASTQKRARFGHCFCQWQFCNGFKNFL